MVWASTQGRSVPDNAHLLHGSQDYLRNVIHAFNEEGVPALEPVASQGQSMATGHPAHVFALRRGVVVPRVAGNSVLMPSL